MLKRAVADIIVPVLDWFFAPLVLISSLLMRAVRRLGIWRMPACKTIFNKVGVYPIRDHYYEPLFDHRRYLKHSPGKERNLPGVDMNETVQLGWLSRFDYADELRKFPQSTSNTTSFCYDNPNFGVGDAECLYSLIRLCKPARIIEIGSGYSTMMAREAIKQNKYQDPQYQCRHTCIEPYEMKWLEKLPEITVIREIVENLDIDMFCELGKNDILFIDSSHMIRPQGDVLREFLEILPVLKPGVLVHIHDIFTPCDYLEHWLLDEVKFWNEQYLLEAFLSCNSQYEIVLALNFLSHHHPNQLLAKFPMLEGHTEKTVPRSIWIRRSK